MKPEKQRKWKWTDAVCDWCV